MDKTTAAEIMSTKIKTALEGTSIEDVIKSLVNSKITGMPVVDKQGRMTGIVSEYDILAQVAKEKHLHPDAFQQPIEYTRLVDSIVDTTPLSEIMEHFIQKKVRRLPVLDSKGVLLGIITRRDLMRVLYYRARLS